MIDRQRDHLLLEGKFSYELMNKADEQYFLVRKQDDCKYLVGIIYSEAAAEAISNLLNNQSKYIIPMNNKGGGFIRKLTKAEVKRQAKLQREAWGLKDEDAGGK